MFELNCCGTHRLSVVRCDVGKLCSHDGDAESAKHPRVYFRFCVKFWIPSDGNIDGLLVLPIVI